AASVENECVILVARRNVADNRNAGALEPEPIALKAKVLDRFAIIGRFGLSRPGRTDREIVVEATDLIADFGDKARAVHIEGDVIGHIHVAGMIDKSPAGTADDGATDNRTWIAVVYRTIAMKVNGIARAWVRAGARLQRPITQDNRIVYRLRLIRSA